MRGGAGEKYLPFNSLLHYTPRFKLEAKAKPIITQEHTSTIVNMIKICVLGEYWDNVIPRALPALGLMKGEDESL